MLIYKTLEWGNAFSYGDNNRIDFDLAPLTQIVAKNGSGKSSIAAILEEVQYNKNSKGIKKSDILNRYLKEKSYWIRLTIEKDGDTYVIYTKRGTTQSVSLTKNGEDISAHTSTNTYKLIEEILGYDHKTFSQIVYQSSAYSLGFLTATDSTRKKFLIDIFKNLEVYTKFGDLYKNLVKEANTECSKYKSAISVIESWLAKIEKENLTPMELIEVPNPPEDLQEELVNLQVSLSNIDRDNKLIVQNNKYKEILDSIDPTPINESTIDVVPLIERKSTISAKIDAAKSKISAHKTKAGVKNCRECGQPVDNSHAEKIVAENTIELTNLTRELDQVSKELVVAQQTNKRVNEYEAKLAEWEKYHSLYKPELPADLVVAKDLHTSIQAITQKIKHREQGIKTASDHNMRAAQHNSRIAVLLSQKDEMFADLQKQKDLLASADKILNARQILSKMFSTGGLLAYKLECMVKDLEEATNQYLVNLSDGRFQLSFQLAEGSDKLNVVITDNGKDIEINALSGGELARVNTATLLGIRKLMQSISNNRTNLLFLDETIDNLDADGKDKVIETLLKEEGLNTFLVSHNYSHPLLEQLWVTKENNCSRISYGR